MVKYWNGLLIVGGTWTIKNQERDGIPPTPLQKKKTKQPLNLAHIANEVHFIAFSYFLFSLFQGLQTGFLLEATVD